MNLIKKRRLSEIRQRKNFAPSLIVTLAFWICSVAIIFFVDPDVYYAKPLFLIILFFALLFTFSILFINTRRGLLIALTLVVALLLRFLGIESLINFLLLFGAALAFEFYFSKKT